MKTENKKKGLLATVWESLTKTGGCCGPGEDCCGPSAQGGNDSDKKEKVEESDKQ